MQVMRLWIIHYKSEILLVIYKEANSNSLTGWRKEKSKLAMDKANLPRKTTTVEKLAPEM